MVGVPQVSVDGVAHRIDLQDFAAEPRHVNASGLGVENAAVQGKMALCTAT
jgi:hypothetical protein